MNSKLWRQRVASWKSFSDWEAEAPRTQDPACVLRLAGEWADFYLKRYPRKHEQPDTSGIEKLRMALSHLIPLPPLK